MNCFLPLLTSCANFDDNCLPFPCGYHQCFTRQVSPCRNSMGQYRDLSQFRPSVHGHEGSVCIMRPWSLRDESRKIFLQLTERNNNIAINNLFPIFWRLPTDKTDAKCQPCSLTQQFDAGKGFLPQLLADICYIKCFLSYLFIICWCGWIFELLLKWLAGLSRNLRTFTLKMLILMLTEMRLLTAIARQIVIMDHALILVWKLQVIAIPFNHLEIILPLLHYISSLV